jgi:hypothetical protein
VFSTAHRKFDLLILDIQILLRESPRDNSEIERLFEEAEEIGLPSLHEVYKANVESMKLYASAEREYRLLRFQYECETADLTDGPTLASKLSEWRYIKNHYEANEKEYDQSDRQILFQIEIMVYIAIERYLRKAIDIDIDNPHIDEARAASSDSEYMTIQEHHYRIDTSWLDVDNTLKQDNGWLFLGSLVDLFAYRVESLPKNESDADEVTYARAISVSHALHMMLDIYQTALWKNEGGVTELTKIFKTRTFFQRYIENCRILMTSIGACSSDTTDDDIFQWLYRLIEHRDTLEKAHITHVTADIKATQKITILKIEKVHPKSDNEQEYYIEEEYPILDWEKVQTGQEEGKKEKVQKEQFKYNWTTYVISLIWGDISEEKEDECIATIRPLMPSIIRGWRRIASLKEWSLWATADTTIFRTVITKMWHVGIPREWWDFFKSVLDPDSIAQRTTIAQVNKDDLMQAKWVPIIITMENNDPAISVVNMGEMEGYTYLAVRFWIIGENISYNLPPYDGICMVKVLPDGTWVRQWVHCNPKNVNWSENSNQSIYERQIEKIGAVIGNKQDKAPEFPCIHNGRLWQIYELGEVITEQRFTMGENDTEVITSTMKKKNFLVQIRTPEWVDVQLIISSYRDNATGKYIMYIGSMVTSGSVDINFISKWFSSILISEGLEGIFPWIKKETEIVWERNDSYKGKIQKVMSLKRWHDLNCRFCKTDTVALDW